MKTREPAVAVWDRVMRFEETMTPTAARALLKLQFAPQDIDRMNVLAAKARQGDLSAAELSESETFERMGCLLDIVHSKARRTLKSRERTA